ncbi:uncharacterized protein LOC133295717 [Gastrolobium bilobum]|uniref:uncharacterized protein LOC133295717 n=1 Tax=Gastrolobium bilobum TaxID=150636 RepID=UPI002AAFCD94|nr:uncharacterized protein LOC133295717 [Gastrolobium bilobum]XP_061350563.1 uncharacterized protein LOC133295717 [Gastrolobium bilobum]XP_061350568.1 uncharacterized protein LOC133295717 [Gastrolobium bilobum]XP_061350574.1 uncharacterized protein LOC133295717 [Gastrolobium bilobum]
MFHRRKKEPSTLPVSNTDTTMPTSSSSSSFLRTPTTSSFSFSFSVSFKSFLFFLSLLLNLYLLFILWAPSSATFHPTNLTIASRVSPTTRRHILFAIASSSVSWPRRQPYLRLWYSPNSTRAFAFLDSPSFNSSSSSSLPPVVISGDTSGFPYTFRGGLRSAIRVARVVKEVVDRNETDVRWFVFGDDDTVFLVENVVRTLSKYDHDRWFYIGGNSESYDQNVKYSFEMAFGGGGFAISHSLGRVLARVLDSCLRRYGHLYGSDSRIYSCLAELGVGLTHEPGFHQLDMRGNLFGMLAAHPLSPLLSLHHLEALEPLFPNMNRTQALEHLIVAANIDPARILQQTVCYDRSNSLTFSVSWGFGIQVFQGNELLPDLLSLQRTFMPWKRGSKVDAKFMFNTRDYPKDPCERPSVFFLKSVTSDERGIWSYYSRHVVGNCYELNATQLMEIIVFSRKLELDMEQMKAPRRQCCNVLPSSNESISIHIRPCEINELISMQS